MITIIIFTFLLIILAYSKKLDNKKFMIYYLITVIIYTIVYFKYDILYLEDSSGLYELLFYKYFPFLCTLFLTIYIRYDVRKNINTINNLEEKILSINDGVEEVIAINESLEEEKRNIEKRLISEEKEAIKIRNIISEISDFNFEKIETKILSYFNQVLPNAIMDYYKKEEEQFIHVQSTKEVPSSDLLNPKILSYLKKSNDSVFSQMQYKDQFSEKIIVKLVADREIVGVILIKDLDFKLMNKITFQSLKYFVNLFCLQMETAVIHQRQKELSFSYNSKNIYNIRLLKKMIEIRVALARREKLTSCVIELKSDDFKDIVIENNYEVFDDFENLYINHFRLQDVMVYNEEHNTFVLVLLLVKGNLHFIEEKIANQLSKYNYTLEHLWIDEESNKEDIWERLGVE